MNLPTAVPNDTIFAGHLVSGPYEAAGIPILQPRTENIMGAQGRLELAPGYIVELAEATNKSLFHPDVETLGLPPSQRQSAA